MAAVLAPMAQAEWLPPVAISATGDYAASPHVALDSEGNATAVWDRWNGSDTVVESSFRPAGQPWGPPENLSEPELEGEFLPGAHDAQSPQVVVDRNGNLTVLWERYAWPMTIIQSVSRAPGGSWSEPVDLAEMSQGANPEPWLAVDWEGNNTAVWKQGEVIMSSFRSFAGAWQEPVPLSEGESFTPEAAMDARGDATAVWMHYDGSHYVVESAYRPEQGEWEAATLVSQPGEEGGNPHVAIDANGDAVVIWRGEDEGQDRIRAAYRAAGGSWSDPVNVSAEGEHVNPQSMRAAVDPDGNAIAAWSGNTGELGGWDIVHAAYKPAGEGWGEPVPLSSEGGNGFPSDVVFDTGGNAALVWGRWDGAANLVQAAYKPAGEEWEPAVDLSQEGKQGMDAVIVLDAPGNESAADGDATAVWVSAESVNCPEGAAPPCYAYEVQAAGYDPDGIPEVTVEAPAEGTTGEPVEVLTPTENLYSPEIEFGDGESVAGTTATHSYDEPGEYEVVAAGAEELGYRGTAARMITIRDSGEGPPDGEESGDGPGSGEPGEGESPGDDHHDGSPAPTMTSATPSTSSQPSPASACESARAARRDAALGLRQAKRRLKRAPSPRRSRMAAAKAATLRRASARVASVC